MESFEFERDVLEKSHETPIVVDFWAPWCGPCRFLGPVIEELAQKATNWRLAKVNTDEHPELMEKYKIRGIPAVKMFHGGEVVAEFTGALPKYQIEKWLEENLPDQRKDLVSQIKKEMTGSNPSEARLKLEDFVRQNPDFPEGIILLAEALVWDDPLRSATLVQEIKIGHKYYDQAENLRNVARLLDCDLDGDSTVLSKIEEARKNFEAGDIDGVLKNLVDAVVMDKEFCEALPRKSTISLFNLLGPTHELTQKYRRQFDMALY